MRATAGLGWHRGIRTGVALVLALVQLSGCGDKKAQLDARTVRSNKNLAADTPARVGEAGSSEAMSKANPLMKKKYAAAIFYPRPDSPFGPRAKGARDHLFKAKNGPILRLRLFLGEPTAPVVFFFHGNGETAHDYDGVADRFRQLPASLVVAEYRGYGTSTGEPTLHEFLDDAHLQFDELKSVLKDEGVSGPIVVMGRSLGSAPAIELAHSRPQEIKGMIIESGFALILPLLELMQIPVHEVGIKEHHGPQNLKKIESIALPTLIIHAEKDQVIPFTEGEMLIKASADPQKSLFKVPLAGHNDIHDHAGDAYFERIGKLLMRINK